MVARQMMCRPGMAWDGMGMGMGMGWAWHGMGWHGTAWDGMARYGQTMPVQLDPWHKVSKACHGPTLIPAMTAAQHGAAQTARLCPSPAPHGVAAGHDKKQA